jgi:hypothetical protein
MAGVVGAGVVFVGFLLARGVLDVPVLVERDGRLVNADVWWYALGAFAAALVATALLHLLLVGAPRPFTFYGWITGLAVVIAGLIPFTTGAELETKVTLCAINLATGTVMAVIIATVGRSALRRPGSSPYGPGGSPYGPGGPAYGTGDTPGGDPYRPQYGPGDPYRDQPGNW